MTTDRRPSKRPAGACLVIAAIVSIVGCAIPVQTPTQADGDPVTRSGILSPQSAERGRAQIAIGKTAKGDVVSALGAAAAVVSFESGYEVWVYRIRSADKGGDSELVLLFDRSGTLAKTRMRLASTPTRAQQQQRSDLQK